MKHFGPALLAVLLAMPARAEAPARREFDLGFVASRIEDANGVWRTRVLGPFLESAVATNNVRIWAARPLYSGYGQPEARRTVRDILWPAGYAVRIEDQLSWGFLVARYLDYDVEDPRSRYRLWVLPVYFQGRGKEGDFYMAVFPLGGKIKDILWKDEVRFLLYPLTAYGRINEVETRDVLWPVFSWTWGKGIERFRVFPFYGRIRHRDDYEKGFILWPFWSWARYHYPGSSGGGYLLFPLWGHIKLEDQESWSFLLPFFRFSRGERLNITYCPWPFIQAASGEKQMLYLWPLWGHKKAYGRDTTFFLWPIFQSQRVERRSETTRRFTARPVLTVERVSAPGDEPGRTNVVRRYCKVWPLISYERDGDASRWRLLELWPLRYSGPVERSWAPLWTFFTDVRLGDARDTELLWGLYRSRRRGDAMRSVSVFPLFSVSRDRRDGDRRAWSLLHGLVGYRRDGTQRSVRVLYLLRFRGKEKKP